MKKENEPQNKKHFEFSKIILLITFGVFLFCIIKGLSLDFTNATYVDLTVYTTAITVSGGILATVAVWYLKKSSAENVYKVKSSMYQSIMDVRLNYMEKVIILKNKYMLTDDELADIEAESPMDEFSDRELDSMTNALDAADAEANSPTEIQNV